EEALHRIQKGTYGICELTGKPIESARLKAVPWTRFSLQAQHELETRGAVNRTRLSQPSSISKMSEDHSEFEEPHNEHE
ncbi:MAG: TraR/DksA family transcriptional regulator, partial [Limisphaerales bacterium]